MRTDDPVRFESLRLRWLSVGILSVHLSAVAAAQPPAPLAGNSSSRHSPGTQVGYIDFGDGPVAIHSDGTKSPVSKAGVDTARPTYAVLGARLANWDADAEPDGWRCRVELRDPNDRIVRPHSAQGAFELRLRVPRRDRSGYRDLGVESIRWSERLVFDPQGYAEVKLPLRSTLPSFYIDGSDFLGRTGIAQARSARHPQAAGQFNALWVAAGEGFVHDSPLTSSAFAPARFGTMVVRVTVPSVGVLEAIDAVLADEPLLVDSNWPQR